MRDPQALAFVARIKMQALQAALAPRPSLHSRELYRDEPAYDDENAIPFRDIVDGTSILGGTTVSLRSNCALAPGRG